MKKIFQENIFFLFVKKQLTPKAIYVFWIHFISAVVLALLFLFTDLILGSHDTFLENNGLSIVYTIIFVMLIVFYVLMTYLNFWLSVLSFLINFIGTYLELQVIEEIYHDSSFYNVELERLVLIVLGSFLWVKNKMTIDKIFGIIKFKLKDHSYFDNYLIKRKTKMLLK